MVDTHFDANGWEWWYDNASAATKAILKRVVQLGGSTEVDFPTAAQWTAATGVNITSIAASCFTDTEGKKITKILSMPSTITVIGNYAFFLNTSLTSVVLGGGLVTIGVGAFQTCTSLTDIIIPNTVTTISDLAFYTCTSLQHITIGSGVTTIGTQVFEDSTSLKSIYFTGLVAPVSVGGTWLTHVPTNVRGHANDGSNFSAPGSTWNGLMMGTYISAASNVTTFTSTPYDPVGLSTQRQSWWSNGLRWVIYEDGTNASYRSSSDGVTWSAATAIVAVNRGYKDSIYFDGTYVHYVYADGTNVNILYRRLTPASDGTISVGGAVTIYSLMYTSYPVASKLPNGYPVAAFCGQSTYYRPACSIATATNGATWSTAYYPSSVTFAANCAGVSIAAMSDNSFTLCYDDGAAAGNKHFYIQRVITATTSDTQLQITDAGWSAPAGLTSVGNGGNYTYLAWVEGSAAPNHTLKFNIYNPYTGLGTPITIASSLSISSISITLFPSITEVGARVPAVISYFDNNILKYVKITATGDIVGPFTLYTEAGTLAGEHNASDQIDEMGFIDIYWPIGTVNPWTLKFRNMKLVDGMFSVLSSGIKTSYLNETSSAISTSINPVGELTTYQAIETGVIKIPVNHTDDGAQTNYQMKLTIYSGNGTNSAGVVYLKNGAANWPYDIVFRNASNTVLDYWRESYDASSQTVWVELDSIAATGTTDFYMYYGNASWVDTSNGVNTFPFFDDFVSIANWTRSEGAVTATVASSIFSINGSVAWTKYYTAGYSVPATGAIRYRSNQAGANEAVGIEPSPCCIDRRLTYNSGYLVSPTAGAADNVGGYWSYNTWYIFDQMRVSGGTTKFYLNNTLSFTSSGTGIYAVPLNIGSIAGLVQVDWILSRNYRGNEPTWATPGETPFRLNSTYLKLPVNSTVDGAQTNYQMKLTIYEGEGANAAGVVYLNHNALNWPYDIVFKNSSNVILDYWRESYSATSQVVWVELDSIASAGATDFYLFYGDTNQGDTSSGDNTFPFYDHFLGSSVDMTKWQTVAGLASGTVGSSEVTLTSGTNRAIGTIPSFGQGYAIRAYIKLPTTSSAYYGFQYNVFAKAVTLLGYTTGHQFFINGVAQGTTSPTFDANYHILDLFRLVGTTNNIQLFVDNSAASYSTKSSADTEAMTGIIITNDPPGGTIVCDWVLIRKITATEPTWAVPVNEKRCGISAKYITEVNAWQI